MADGRSDQTENTSQRVVLTRRNVVRTAAWATPAVVVATAAPALAVVSGTTGSPALAILTGHRPTEVLNGASGQSHSMNMLIRIQNVGDASLFDLTVTVAPASGYNVYSDATAQTLAYAVKASTGVGFTTGPVGWTSSPVAGTASITPFTFSSSSSELQAGFVADLAMKWDKNFGSTASGTTSTPDGPFAVSVTGALTSGGTQQAYFAGYYGLPYSAGSDTAAGTDKWLHWGAASGPITKLPLVPISQGANAPSAEFTFDSATRSAYPLFTDGS